MEENLRLYTYLAYVTDVYDGDTITVSINLGFNTWKVGEKIRLLGIDTPEIRGEEREKGIEVRDYVRELVLNKSIVLQTVKDKKGKYGRYLGNVYYQVDEDNWESLNENLLVNNMAVEYKK